MRSTLGIKSNQFIMIATMLFIVGGMMNWFNSTFVELLISGLLIALIGLPHGATDLLLYKYLPNKPSDRNLKGFLFHYLCLISGYGIVWLINSKIALLLFIIISIYHFGQSNWNFIKVDNIIFKIVIYFISGSFVMLTPLIVHFELTMNIIEGMTGISSLPMDYTIISSLPRSLFIINIWVLFYFFSKQWISKKDLLLQILNVILLLFAFYYLPLIMGFTLYFVFYHAYGSMLDQMTFLKQQELHFSWKMYFKNALPTTLLAIGFIITCFVVNDYFDFGYSIIQMFFVILSLFTLPHILLIEQVFSQTKMAEVKALQVI